MHVSVQIRDDSALSSMNEEETRAQQKFMLRLCELVNAGPVPAYWLFSSSHVSVN